MHSPRPRQRRRRRNVSGFVARCVAYRSPCMPPRRAKPLASSMAARLKDILRRHFQCRVALAHAARCGWARREAEVLCLVAAHSGPYRASGVRDLQQILRFVFSVCSSLEPFVAPSSFVVACLPTQKRTSNIAAAASVADGDVARDPGDLRCAGLSKLGLAPACVCAGGRARRNPGAGGVLARVVGGRSRGGAARRSRGGPWMCFCACRSLRP